MYQNQRSNTSQHNSTTINLPKTIGASTLSTNPDKASTNQSYYAELSQNIRAWFSDVTTSANESVQQVLQPITEPTSKFLKTIDLNKIERDLTGYAVSTKDILLNKAAALSQDLENYIDSASYTPSKEKTNFGSFVDTCKSACSVIFSAGSKLASYCMPAIDYFGEGVFGTENYNWAKDRMYDAMQKVFQLLEKNIFGSFAPIDKNEKEQTFRESFIGHLDTSIHLSIDDAREALDYVNGFLNHLGASDEKKDFLAHRITDEQTEDGIKKEQPDVIRKELLDDIVRKVSDPFPTYEDRVKDEKEREIKAKYEKLAEGNFARVGIDGEMSAADQLEVALYSSQYRFRVKNGPT